MIRLLLISLLLIAVLICPTRLPPGFGGEQGAGEGMRGGGVLGAVRPVLVRAADCDDAEAALQPQLRPGDKARQVQYIATVSVLPEGAVFFFPAMNEQTANERT